MYIVRKTPKIELFFREQIIRFEAGKERLLAESTTDDEKLSLKEQLNSLTIQKGSLETELKLAQNKANELEKRLVVIINFKIFLKMFVFVFNRILMIIIYTKKYKCKM